MKVLTEYKGYQLLERYEKTYIRFWGGRNDDMPCEFPITDEDAQRALSAPEIIDDLISEEESQVEWIAETFYKIGIIEYLLHHVKQSQARAEKTYAKFLRHTDIRNEFYQFIMDESFPKNGMEIEGFTAEYLANNYPLFPLGAYNYLIYLREMPGKALADLKAGLLTKDSVHSE